MATLNGQLTRLQDDHVLLNQTIDAISFIHTAFPAHPPLKESLNPTSSTGRNLRTPGSKRTSRNRDEDDNIAPVKPTKRGRKEDLEIYGEGGMWERDKATRVFGASDDLGTVDLATIRKVMGVTRTGKAAMKRK